MPTGTRWTYSTDLPEGLSIGTSTGVISGTIGFSASGPHSVSVTVSDGKGGSTATSFAWSVDTQPPACSHESRTAGQRRRGHHQSRSHGIGPGRTSYVFGHGPPSGLELTVFEVAFVTGTVDFIAAGPHTVSLSVSDGHAGTSSAIFNWNVSNTNRAPFVADPGSKQRRRLCGVPGHHGLGPGRRGTEPSGEWPPSGPLHQFQHRDHRRRGCSGRASGSPYSVTVTASDRAAHPPGDPSWTVTPLPLPWTNQDVGAVGLAGSASFFSGTFTASGAGTGIGATADQFHYVFQTLNGSGDLRADRLRPERLRFLEGRRHDPREPRAQLRLRHDVSADRWPRVLPAPARDRRERVVERNDGFDSRLGSPGSEREHLHCVSFEQRGELERPEPSCHDPHGEQRLRRTCRHERQQYGQYNEHLDVAVTGNKKPSIPMTTVRAGSSSAAGFDHHRLHGCGRRRHGEQV